MYFTGSIRSVQFDVKSCQLSNSSEVVLTVSVEKIPSGHKLYNLMKSYVDSVGLKCEPKTRILGVKLTSHVAFRIPPGIPIPPCR